MTNFGYLPQAGSTDLNMQEKILGGSEFSKILPAIQFGKPNLFMLPEYRSDIFYIGK